MATKKLNYYLVVNWQKERISARKTKKDNLGPYELQIEADLEIDIPDVDVPVISEQLEVPQPTVNRIAQEAIFEEEFPDWYETVEDCIARATPDHSDYEVLGWAMEDTKGVPNPDEVLDYIRQRREDANA